MLELIEFALLLQGTHSGRATVIESPYLSTLKRSPMLKKEKLLKLKILLSVLSRVILGFRVSVFFIRMVWGNYSWSRDFGFSSSVLSELETVYPRYSAKRLIL